MLGYPEPPPPTPHPTPPLVSPSGAPVTGATPGGVARLVVYHIASFVVSRGTPHLQSFCSKSVFSSVQIIIVVKPPYEQNTYAM